MRFCVPFGFLASLFALFVASCAKRAVEPYDLCIYSGSEAGFTAAIQAARMGKSAVLVEPTGHAGA